ncbi:hypothetical protein LXL04_004091 [Taraxacum kok-saghyz]
MKRYMQPLNPINLLPENRNIPTKMLHLQTATPFQIHLYRETISRSACKLKSPLPPRPPPSSSLKRKLSNELPLENGVAGSSDTGVKVIVRMRPPRKNEEEGEIIVQKTSGDSLSILRQPFTFDSIGKPAPVSSKESSAAGKDDDEEWDDLDLRAASAIRLSLAKNVLANVHGISTAKELWEKLEQLYQGKGISNRLYLKEQFHTLRMNGDTKISDHLSVLNNIVSELEAIGVKVEDEDKALRLILSLPSSYEHMKPILMYGKETLKYADVTGKLLSEEKRMESSGHTSSSEGMFLVDIFQMVGAPLVENCIAGLTVLCLHTGSGKTYTIWGPSNALLDEDSSSDQQGLTPRAFERLFLRINEEQNKHTDKQLMYQCRCSFLEIYNEQITDLLDPAQRNLQIREDTKTGVYFENLREESVCSIKNVTQLLKKGLSNRRIGATSINMESSRSHSVFTCVVESRCKCADGLSSLKTSRINLVDLAGSERQKSTGAAGERLKEAGNINRSLSHLGNLINILAEVSQTGKQRHIPYRDSKLTFSLQESLRGNAKLAMVCAISPAQSTLRFAKRAKAIKNKAVVNEQMQEDLCKRLRTSSPFTASHGQSQTKRLTASLHRGLEVICKSCSPLARSSFRFSCTPLRKDVGMQVLLSLEDPFSEEKKKEIHGLVPVNGSQLVDDKSKQLVPKAVEKVLAGAIRIEMALQDLCTEIMQHSRLVCFCFVHSLNPYHENYFFTLLTTFITSQVQQYKHERECNSIIGQFQDDKIARLENLMDGVLSSEEYVKEEVTSLANENMVHILHLANFSRLNRFSIIY